MFVELGCAKPVSLGFIRSKLANIQYEQVCLAWVTFFTGCVSWN